MEEKNKEKQKTHSISKLERILSVHSLERLVYQKRQRKQVMNPFVQPFQPKKVKPKPQIPKSKKQVVEEKKKEKLIQSEKNNEKKVDQKNMDNSQIKQNEEQKKEQPKKRGRPRKTFNTELQQKQPQQIDQNANKLKTSQKQQLAIVNQNVVNEEENEQQLDIIQKKNSPDQKKKENKSEIVKNKCESKEKKKKKKKKKLQNHNCIQKKKDQKIKERKSNSNDNHKQNQQISSNDHKSQNKNKQQNNQHLLKEKKKQQQKEKQQQQQQSSHEQKSQEQEKEQEQEQCSEQESQEQHQEQQQRDEKEQNGSQQYQDQEQEQSSSSSSQSSSSSSSQEKQEEEDQENEGLTRKNRKKSVRVDEADNNQMEYDEQQCRTRKLRERKSKDQAIKKRMFQGYLQSDDIELYQYRRRKGVSGAQKEYPINRIFRRNQKLNFPNVKLEVDIMKFSLQHFAQKIQHFDMIHCSLPIDMLIKLPSISSLIPKGFIFIWVQKGQIQIGYHWFSRIGFDVIDQIIWIKTNSTVSEVVCDENTQDEIFPNCRSVCLVGYKCSASQKTEYKTKISNNIIFCPGKPASIQYPDEIYQIGDLMMPGARKLEIGFKEVGGWFTLKHKEESFVRCHQCLRKDRRTLFYTQNKSIKCEYCLIYNLKQQQSEQNLTIQKQSNKKEQILLYEKLLNQPLLYKLQVINKKFVQSLGYKCSQCHQSAPQLMQIIMETSEEEDGANSDHENNIVNNNIVNKNFCKKQIKLLCKQCLIVPQQTSLIKVFNLKEIYFPSKFVKCSKCNKNELQKYYFECFTCKNQHILCSQCLLSIPMQTQPSNKNHEWKLKILNDFPQTRVTCFICAQECMIPYWGCQTCQNWYWCGTCDFREKPKIHQNHCHYNREHNLHFII